MATGQAIVIVIVVSLIVGLGRGYLGATSVGVATVPAAIIGGLSQLVAAVIGWAFGSWLTAFVARIIFHGRTNTLEMLRVLGYTWVYRVIGIIPVVGVPIGAVLSIIGNTIGIREASELDTLRAILTAVISGVIIYIIIVGIVSSMNAVFVAIGLAPGAAPM